jgi:hypothetical protein
MIAILEQDKTLIVIVILVLILKGSKQMNKKISFHFQPKLTEKGTMLIEKSFEGKKRRYLEGVSSGLKEDAHKERMSENAIAKFMKQANSGDILLFPDIHGIRQSEDIGILEEAFILPNGDWFTSYRLYDEYDEPGQIKLEKINNLWKQLQGLPPYTKPKQMGFSIEGVIAEKGIITTSRGDTILDDIELDGTVLVPRPAYLDGIANAVFKALDILPPWTEDKVKKESVNKLTAVVKGKDIENAYWSMKFDINNALEELVENIMGDKKAMKKERLEVVFKQYNEAAINLILESSSVFKQSTINEEIINTIKKSKSKTAILKALNEELNKLQKMYSKENNNDRLKQKS